MAEISKLTTEIAYNRVIQIPINPFTASANENLTQEPQFNFEDLRIVGYTAFICHKCLIFHPLTLYWHNTSMKVIPANHECDTNTVQEVQQQKRNKKDIIETVSNEVPKLMFQVVRRWTRGRPLVQAEEIKPIPEYLHCCTLVNGRNWFLRAIQYGFTSLADDELLDFLNLTKGNTHGIFRTAKSNKTYHMGITFHAAPKDHIG